VVSGQWSVVSGQWSVVSVQCSVFSVQWAVGRLQVTDFTILRLFIILLLPFLLIELLIAVFIGDWEFFLYFVENQV